MRAAVLAIAVLMGGTALAQTSTTSGNAGNTGSGDMAATTTQPTDDQSQSTTNSTTTTQSSTTGEQTQTGWNTSGQTAMASNTMNSTGMVVQPGNANPKRDARGVRVISAPAVVPIGYNGTTGEAMGGPLVDPNTGQAVANASAQACTRTVTDHCVQTYERGRRR